MDGGGALGDALVLTCSAALGDALVLTCSAASAAAAAMAPRASGDAVEGEGVGEVEDERPVTVVGRRLERAAVAAATAARVVPLLVGGSRVGVDGEGLVVAVTRLLPLV
jgi:hypothetical protein